MRLVESHIIKKNNHLWKECDRICFLSKNLYNQALYRVNGYYEETGEYKNYNAIVKELAKEKQVDYIAINTKVSQQTLMLLDKNFRSYFEALKSYKKDKSKFTGVPKKPRYKHKVKGRFNAEFTIQTISKKELKYGIIKLASTQIRIPTSKIVRHARIVPLKNGYYKIELIYLQKEPNLINNKRYVGVDIGLNNLATVVSNNDLKPFIINGRPLKSINQYYNKKLSKLKSELPFYINNNGEKGQRKTSNRIESLTHKRNCKVNDYMHKESRKLVDILKQHNISKVVIGKNNQWKTEINIGKKNNQKFVSIPHSRFINMVIYKLRLEGIDAVCREESYTSKCSFLDKEEIKKHETYLGKRIKRGLFKTSKGFIWNADCNGASNILKKEIPNAFANGIEGVVVRPIRIKSYIKPSSNVLL